MNRGIPAFSFKRASRVFAIVLLQKTCALKPGRTTQNKENQMKFNNINDWLEYIEGLHSTTIDLGLDRMNMMIEKLAIKFDCPVVTVAGTNGKGSTCSMLESIYRASGRKTCMHTSPHLIRFSERCRVNGREAGDEEIMRCFQMVEDARGDATLSYFEYTALAVLKLFQLEEPDVVILEIGLGGRLDAINAVDPDASVISTIGIDHVAFLGDTREKIGWEKAHVFRSGRPAVVSDPEPPATVVEYAEEIGADLRLAGSSFKVEAAADGSFDFQGRNVEWKGLSKPGLAGSNQYRNAAGVLAVVEALQDRLPVSREQICAGLESVRVPGRFEKVADEPCTIILDVGHNPEAAAVLAANIKESRLEDEHEIAVFGMLHDKDQTSVARALSDSFDEWFVGSLTGPRAASAAEVADHMKQAGVKGCVSEFDSIASALAAAVKRAGEIKDRPVRIIVFGSFVTVAAAVEALGLSV